MVGSEKWLREWINKQQKPGPGSAPQAPPRPIGPASFADKGNDFAVAMFEQLRQSPGNLFFSPLSIRIALGMTQAGARGETATQMREALGLSSSDERQHLAFAEIIQQLNVLGGGKVEMAVANSLWGQDGVALEPEFLDLITRHYGGAMNLVDFHNDAETACENINQWVEDKTRQRIQNLLSPSSVDASTLLVLVNAIYFKGKWMSQFRKKATRDQPFYLEGGGHGAGTADAPA